MPAGAAGAEGRLQAARQALAAGRAGEALALLEPLTARGGGLAGPARAAAFAFRGSAEARLGDPAAAAASFREAARADRRDPGLACNLGAALQQAGRPQEALDAFREAARRDPRFAPAAYGSGVVLAALGRHGDAAQAFRKACALAPGMLEARENLAMALAAGGETAAADLAWQEALAAVPRGSPQARRAAAGFARHLAATARPAEALPQFAAAGAGEPGADGALVRDYGAALLQAGRPAEAAALLAGPARATADPDLLSNLGAAHLAAGAPEAALPPLRRALALAPAHRAALVHLAHALQALGELEQAAAHHRRALAEAPAFLPALIGLANVLNEAGELSASDAAFAAAEAAAPGQPQLRWNRALHDLLLGRYAAGWDGYALRWQVPDFPTPWRATGIPDWHGEEVRGRHLFVWGEQGPGDEIMFATCLPDLLQAGARVTLATDPRLQALFARSFPGVAVQAADAPPPADADYTLPIGDLPRHFRREAAAFPARRAILRADPAAVADWRARWRDEVGAERRVVGLSWKGGVTAAERRRRGAALAAWAPLLRLPGLAWINMQYGADAAAAFDEAAAAHGLAVATGPDPGGDLDALAAAVAAADAVASMANTLVHLAGGLGRPILVAVPAAPSWRWQRDRADSPWYPSARLIRQAAGEPWSAAVARAAAALPQLLGTDG